ncbi:DUF6276 family protein [Halovivax gelatinilyticus]|uniref:DUF6276 family protein n=1 Tax=Halovivax gelatinilyticus TaxID=2961597 RepID=UPI0020CA8DE8|nr:DUF6276 family protein [Halovivax gelatinilyticus]
MSCSCPADPVVFTVPPSLRAAATGLDAAADRSNSHDEPTVAAICPTCLSVVRRADSAATNLEFSRISASFPDGEGGVALALMLGLLDSLVHNRAGIEAALEAAERAGVDPLLVIDRLLDDRSIEPAIDLERRRDKLESLVY